MTCEKHYWYHGPLVDCPHCEIDRLRTELDKFKAFPNVDMLRLCMIDVADENDRLKSELAKAQEENEKLRCRNKAQHVEIKATTAYSIGQDKALAAQQKRIKELELSASEQYVKGREAAAKAIEKHFCGIDEYGACYATFVRARIQEVKNEGK